MRDNNCRAISIRTMEYDVSRLLERELERPLAELSVEAVQKIKERGRNHRTQTNRSLAHLSAIWNTTRRLRRSSFTAENPVGQLGVVKSALTGDHEPDRPRVRDADLLGGRQPRRVVTAADWSGDKTKDPDMILRGLATAIQPQ